MRERVVRGGSLGVLAALLAAALVPVPLVSVPARAATSTSAVWTVESLVVDYGASWHLQVQIDRAPPEFHEFGPLPVIGSADGTVDVLLDDEEEPWAAGLPVVEGGAVYVSQPRDRESLPAGEHELRAVFTPSDGSELNAAETARPVALTIASFPIAAEVESLGAPEDDSLAWEVRLGLVGEWVERNGAVPAGTWDVRLFEGRQQRLVEDRRIAVERTDGAGAEPIRFERLRDATAYTVVAVFEPSAAVAGGLELEQSEPVSHEVRGSLGAILEAPLTVQVPIVLAGGAVLLLLLLTVVALVALLVRIRIRTSS